MSSLASTTVLAVVRAAEEAHSEPVVPAWVVGLIALGILLALLAGVVAFGGGREHS